VVRNLRTARRWFAQAAAKGSEGAAALTFERALNFIGVSHITVSLS